VRQERVERVSALACEVWRREAHQLDTSVDAAGAESRAPVPSEVGRSLAQEVEVGKGSWLLHDQGKRVKGMR
jgi:hypothetical protein